MSHHLVVRVARTKHPGFSRVAGVASLSRIYVLLHSNRNKTYIPGGLWLLRNWLQDQESNLGLQLMRLVFYHFTIPRLTRQKQSTNSGYPSQVVHGCCTMLPEVIDSHPKSLYRRCRSVVNYLEAYLYYSALSGTGEVTAGIVIR